jgi:hypothetical protein
MPFETQGLLDLDRSLETQPMISVSGPPQRATITSTFLAAFGVATLCCLPILGDIASPTHETIYHLSGSVSTLIVPAVLNLFLVAFLLALFLRWVRPLPRLEATCWMILLGAMPWIALRNISLLYGFSPSNILNHTVFAACFVTILVFSWLWTPARNPAYARAQRIGALVLEFIAIFGLILVLQIIWVGWQARHLNDISSVTPASPQPLATHHSRVFWIVFDELSYDQVYGSRYPGLKLPTLDSFAQQSTVFTHVVPTGFRTQAILPSLISGVPDDSVRASSDGHLLYLHVPASPAAAAHWQIFQPEQTVFAEAQSLGFHPAIVGWYNPYCRLLSRQLSSCVWANNFSRMFPTSPLQGNLFYSIVRPVLRIPHFFFPHSFRAYDQIFPQQMHIDDYKQLYSAADKALADPSLDFVFLHMPIPHPGGIYDRRRGVLTTDTSTYIDNLALVDKYLAHLRQTLQQEHEWDDATILIMGDHSWRTQLIWESAPDWTEEEQRASHGGQFDDRPFYALKLPAQQTSAHITSTVHALNTRNLLDALLRHQIQTPQQLDAWVRQAR